MESVEKEVGFELTVDHMNVAVSFRSAPMECVRDVTASIVETVLSDRHHAIRERVAAVERERLLAVR